MFAQNGPECEMQEAQRKAQLDYNTAMKYAGLAGREEGIALGLNRGQKVGIVHFCEKLLHRPPTPPEQLAGLPLEDLARLAEDLKEQVLRQR